MACQAFAKRKQILTDAVPLADLRPDATLKVVYDTSNDIVGAVDNLVANDTTQSISFFTTKLSPSQSCCSTFGLKLLGTFEALRHFRYGQDDR